jgi:hypothetical protein
MGEHPEVYAAWFPDALNALERELSR